jgi:exodeoxyribonuclease VIII
MTLKLEKGMFTGIPNDTYHADRRAVSKSWLDRVAQSPYHLWLYLNEPFKKTDALVIGSAVDCLIFEPEEFDKQFIQGIKADKRSKAGKDAWDKVYMDAAESGRDIISQHLKVNQWDMVHKTADAIRSNGYMKEILSAKNGVAQPVFICKDPVTGMWRKVKLDYYVPGELVFDLKTTVSAHPFKFAKSIADFRYHVQDAYYGDVVRDVTGNDLPFVFGAVEKADVPSPNLMAFYTLPEEEREAGRATYETDLFAVSYAVQNDEWAGYTDNVLEITRPAWAIGRDQ